ncbi:hypothetical protein BJ982_000605 [Sphaerisporangium siamense]|uniref:Uncharacterized protein n=1 Tax=Sphaerisporangium siamense TaxID=795645 RepID=A0A7W7D2S1_9ACTN|nr:hypothetical protein [Sphaerisporangium siamense]
MNGDRDVHGSVVEDAVPHGGPIGMGEIACHTTCRLRLRERVARGSQCAEVRRCLRPMTRHPHAPGHHRDPGEKPDNPHEHHHPNRPRTAFPPP